MKIALITDTHIGARNDSEVFSQYFVMFFQQVFLPYLEENNIQHIIHLGDFFDRRKYVNFKTLNYWDDNVLQKLAKYNLNIVVGNHDVYYKNTNQINSVGQLLSKYNNWKIYTSPTNSVIDDINVVYLPWINSSNYDESMEMIKTTKAEICFGHLELKGFEIVAGQVNHDKGFDKKVFRNFDLVFSGHFHQKSDDGSIYYLGSPYHITWNDWGQKRGFYIFDTETRNIEFVENPYQIFHKVYYDDTKETYESLMDYDFSFLQRMYVKVIVRNKINAYWFEQFIDNINKWNPSDVSVVEVSVDEDNEDVDQVKDTLTLLTEYVNNLDIQYKDRLTELLRDLYYEAVNMDPSSG